MAKRVSIDFRPARGSERTALVCTTLKHGNASGMVMNAYRNYRPAQPEAVTAITDMNTRIEAFIKMYNIHDRKDVIDAVHNEPYNRDTELLEPGEKNISFPEGNSDAQELIETLEQVRYRDRGAIVTRIVHQYLAQGNSEYYNELSAKTLFNWLKEEISEPEELRDPAAEDMIDRIAATAEEKNTRTKVRARNRISDDDFRRMIGII